MSNRIILNREQTFKIIKEVHLRPCLWNPYVEEYGKRHLVAEAWGEVSKRMDNLPVIFLRNKWKSLRDTYKKEMKRCPDPYNGSWRYFKRLSFLVFKSCNEENNETDQAECEQSEKDTDDSNDLREIPLIKQEPSIHFQETIPEKRRKPNEEEFDVLFLHSLAPYFKQLDPIRKLVVRSKIQDMLFNEISAQNSGNGPQYD